MRRYHQQFFGLVLALCVTTWAAAAQAGVRFDTGGKAIASATADDWFSHPVEDKYYTENWTTMVRTEAGHVFYITFLRSNIGVFSGSAGLTVSATMPGKQAKIFDIKYKLDDFSQDKASGRISVKGNYIQKKGRKFTLHVDEKDLAMDLEISAHMDGVKFHTGRFFLDKSHQKSVTTYVHAPWGSVKGKVTVAGQSASIQGDAFVDHLHQNVLGTDYATHWWVLRYFSKDYAISFFIFKSPKTLGRKVISRILISSRTEVLEQSNVMTFEGDQFTKDPKGHKYATRYKFGYFGEKVTVEGTATNTRLHDRDAMLERMSAVERKIVELVAGKPINYRSLADSEIKIKVGDGEEQTLTGTSYLETIVLVGD